MQLSQETIKFIFYSVSEVQRKHFCGTYKRTENRRTCYRFRWRNDENRPSLTSGAVAEEGQKVSSKNTIDDLADDITRGKDISLWSSNIRKKCGNIGWKTKLFLKHDVPQDRKGINSSRKCTTNLIRRQNHNAEVVERSWLCFFPSQAWVYCFRCRLMCADTTKSAHFLIRKEICDWKHAEESRATNGT